MSHNILPPRDTPGVPEADYGLVADRFLDKIARDAGATARACKQLKEVAQELQKLSPQELCDAECILKAMEVQLGDMEKLWLAVVMDVYEPTPPYGLDIETLKPPEPPKRITQPLPVSRRPKL